MSTIADFAQILEASPLGLWARGSSVAYPGANLLHLLGLILLIGGIGIVDLRLAGAWRSIPLEAFSRALTPLAVAGLVLLGASGLVLFAADAGPLIGSKVFLTKLVLISVALANAFVFRAIWRGRLPTWDAAPPLAGRSMAIVSVGLWLLVAALGRMIAYT